MRNVFPLFFLCNFFPFRARQNWREALALAQMRDVNRAIAIKKQVLLDFVREVMEKKFRSFEEVEETEARAKEKFNEMRAEMMLLVSDPQFEKRRQEIAEEFREGSFWMTRIFRVFLKAVSGERKVAEFFFAKKDAAKISEVISSFGVWQKKKLAEVCLKILVSFSNCHSFIFSPLFS